NPMRSSAIIAIGMQTDLSRKVPEWEDLAATACAVQNLWLAATALGVSGYWSTPGSLDELSDFVGLEEGQKCLGLFYLGYASEYPDAPNRSPWDEKVQWRDE
ncbi:MAG: nitroreductase family protein, partial [Saprospiraceae bacterium]|nr:nitroreductase family protein [Saprospiraceae bacterium]